MGEQFLCVIIVRSNFKILFFLATGRNEEAGQFCWLTGFKMLAFIVLKFGDGKCNDM